MRNIILIHPAELSQLRQGHEIKVDMQNGTEIYLKMMSAEERKIFCKRSQYAALEEDLERTGDELAKVEAERDALLEELQRLADCSSCKFNTPDAVDGCSALMPCKDGSMWEWKGVKNENR